MNKQTADLLIQYSPEIIIFSWYGLKAFTR